MASSTGATTLKAALVIAMLPVLLHSSTGQQRPAAPEQDCGNCTSKCTSACQGVVEYETSLCNTTSHPGVVFGGCLGRCANSTCNCNGNFYSSHADRCTIGTCSSDHCGGNHCVQNCCKSCTDTAHAAYDGCVASAPSRGMQECMPGRTAATTTTAAAATPE